MSCSYYFYFISNLIIDMYCISYDFSIVSYRYISYNTNTEPFLKSNNPLIYFFIS